MSDKPIFVHGFCVTQADLNILLCYLQSATEVKRSAADGQTKVILPGALVTYGLEDSHYHLEDIPLLFNAVAPTFHEGRGDQQTLCSINEAHRSGNFGIIDGLASVFSEDPIASAFAYGFHHGLGGQYPLDSFSEKARHDFSGPMVAGRSPFEKHLLLAITSGSIYGNKDRTNVDLSNLNVRQALSRSDQEGFRAAALDLFVTGYRGQAIDDSFRLASSRTEEYLLFERRMRKIHSPQRQRPYRHP